MTRPGSRPGRPLAVAVAALALAASSAAFAQEIEIAESRGYAEALLPSIGWRQAVIGRRLPAGSILSAWIGAEARMEYEGASLVLGPMGRLEVREIGADSIYLVLTEGELTVDAGPMRVAVEYRGVRASTEGGALRIADGTIAVDSGAVLVEGYAGAPVALESGARLDLFERKKGAVLGP